MYNMLRSLMRVTRRYLSSFAIIRQFGAKTINVKPIVKTIPTIFAHADKGVRTEVMT